MKKSNLFLNMILGVALIFGVSSCKEDPVVPPSGGDGIPVADGFYLAAVGADPASTAQLKSATVDAPSFGAMDREGFVQGYMYLTAGSYNLVEVEAKAVINTFGGPGLEITDGNAECDDNTAYTLVGATADGAAFSIPADGLYVVTYDAQTSEIVYDEMVGMGIIGAATPGGWGADTPMIGQITAEGASFNLEGVTLDVGQMKFRYNCRWAIDRRIDKGEDFDNANGYSLFTNYGNEIANLLPGNEGPNIEVTEYAVYTVTFALNLANGTVSSTLTKTGEAEPKPEYPAELYLVGATVGTAGGWDWDVNGIKMIPVHSNPHLFWRIVWMNADATDPGMKFSPIASWDDNFGVEAGSVPTDGIWNKGAENYPGPNTSGYYMVVVNLESGAETIEVNEPLVYGIGDAFGAWDAATPEYLFTVDNAMFQIKFEGFAADGNLRMHVAATTMKAIGSDPVVEWWQAEFTVLNSTIEYRGVGDDQTAVPVTAGGNVFLNFSDGTGAVN